MGWSGLNRYVSEKVRKAKELSFSALAFSAHERESQVVDKPQSLLEMCDRCSVRGTIRLLSNSVVMGISALPYTKSRNHGLFYSLQHGCQ